ncbi:MAG: hypothetical protein ACOC0R_06770 [Mariniphaga sp.]
MSGFFEGLPSVRAFRERCPAYKQWLLAGAGDDAIPGALADG